MIITMNNGCSIYFITDCHFCDNFYVQKNQVSSLANIIKNDQNKEIILSIGGDLSFSGNKSDFNVVSRFINDLSLLSQKEIKFISCPGNHDICYNKDEEYNLSQFILDCNKENYKTKLQSKLEKMKDYNTFLSANNSKIQHINPILDKFELLFDNCKLVIYSLNDVVYSCFGEHSCSDTSYGKIYIPEDLLNPIKKYSSNEIVVLLMHFPYAYFDSSTQNIFRQIVEKHVDIILSGHRHIFEPTTINNINHIVGNAYAKNDEHHSSSFVKIDLSNLEYRVFIWDKDIYIENLVQSIILNKINKNSFDLSISNLYLEENYFSEQLGHKFNIKDIYVFPCLSSRKYKDAQTDYQINNFNEFLNCQKKHRVIAIFADEYLGKTSLAKHLFLQYFESDYFPILCKGSDLKKAVNPSKLISHNINILYDNADNAKAKFSTLLKKDKKILIIDDFGLCNVDLLSDYLDYFGCIILFSNFRYADIFDRAKFVDSIPILQFNLEPFYKDKRINLYKKIYTLMSANNNNNSPIQLSRYADNIERVIKQISLDDCYDPSSLINFAISAYEGSLSFENKFFSKLFQAKSMLFLDHNNKKLGLDYENKSIERIVSELAYNMYLSSSSTFSSTQLNDLILKENSTYGDSRIKCDRFLELLTKSLIISQKENSEFSFYSRDIFAYYIAFHIHLLLQNMNDHSGLEYLLKQDLFSPLHFNVMMCLSAIYDNPYIPVQIISKISKESSYKRIFTISQIASSGITKDKIDKLKRLTKADIDHLNKKEAEIERNRHEDYIKNKNNYFYVEKVEKDIKEIVLWLNKLKISNALLHNFSGVLTLTQKMELVDLVLKIPNIILDEFDSSVFKELDNIFAEYSKAKGNSADAINLLKNEIINLKRAFILATYATSGSSFTNYRVINFLRDELKKRYVKTKDPLLLIQSLMYLSFASKQECVFISKCTELINTSGHSYDIFIQSCARLIGRNFIKRNYEFCMSEQKEFVNLIFGTSNRQYLIKKFLVDKKNKKRNTRR